VVTIALETGLRRGELLGLTWDRIDLSRGVIRLEVTKSGKRREVPMRQVLYDVLAALPEPREGRVFRTRSIRTAFENAVEEARIDSLHFHDLRHHFASWFVMRGGTLPALQKLLGHADLKMTLRYAHLAPEYLRDEVTKTERTNGNGNGSCSHDGLDGGSSLNCCCFWCRSGDSNPDTLAGTRP
jgi:integrase